MFLHVFFVWIFFGVSILGASNNKPLDGLRHDSELSCFVPFIKNGKIKKEIIIEIEENQRNISPLTVSSFGSRFQSPVISSNTPIKESLKRLQEAAEREEIQSNDKKIKKRSHSRKENIDEKQNPSIEEQNLKKARKL